MADALIAFIESSKEKWEMSGSKFYCLNGGYTVEYSWDGSRFAPIGTAGAAAASSSSSSSTAATNAASMAPYGEVRGEELMWFFPADAAITHGAPFYSARATSFGYQTTHFGDERGGGVVSMRWESKERDVREQYLVFDPAASHGPAVHPNDHGGDRWELMGPFPHAVALFIALYTRANMLMEVIIARRKRSYRRCEAFTAAGGKVAPVVCAVCVARFGADVCVCCSNRHASIAGRVCRNCSMKRNFCAKCGDLCIGDKVPGHLCSRCGIGSDESKCCNMKFS